MPQFMDRVASKAVDVRVFKVMLSLIAVPFYVIGVLAAVVWLVARWCVAAIIVGFQDVKRGDVDAV